MRTFIISLTKTSILAFANATDAKHVALVDGDQIATDASALEGYSGGQLASFWNNLNVSGLQQVPGRFTNKASGIKRLWEAMQRLPTEDAPALFPTAGAEFNAYATEVLAINEAAAVSVIQPSPLETPAPTIAMDWSPALASPDYDTQQIAATFATPEPERAPSKPGITLRPVAHPAAEGEHALLGDTAMAIAIALVKAVRAHAVANYNKAGWDYVVETFEDADILREVVEAHPDKTLNAITAKLAIAAVGKAVKPLADMRSEVRAAGGVDEEERAQAKERKAAAKASAKAAKAIQGKPGRPRKAAPDATPKPAKVTQKSTVIALLRRPEGACVHEIMEATGWVNHTARGFLSAGLGDLKAQLVSASEEGRGKVHRLPAVPAPTPAVEG